MEVPRTESISPDRLLREVADTIRELQGQPTASDLCLEALDTFLADRSEANRMALRAAYLEIPEHMRRYVLGDMDRKDGPLRVLTGDIGDPISSVRGTDSRPITEADKAAAFAYFEDRKVGIRRWRETTNNGDPDGRPPADSHPSIDHSFAFIGTGGWNIADGNGFLSNSLRLPIDVDGVEYPSVAHAYWAMSAAQPEDRDAIRAAESPAEAKRLALEAGRRDDWPVIRLAVMIDLLRRKFRQHPDLADRLLATGDARIRCLGTNGTFWDSGSNGRNWLGRALELVRSEIALADGTAADEHKRRN